MKKGDIIISYEIDTTEYRLIIAATDDMSLEDECCVFYDKKLRKTANQIFSTEELLEL